VLTKIFIYRNELKPRLALSTKLWPFMRIRLTIALMKYQPILI